MEAAAPVTSAQVVLPQAVAGHVRCAGGHSGAPSTAGRRPFGPLNFHAERWTIVLRASVPTGLGETNPTAAKRFGVADARLTPAVGGCRGRRRRVGHAPRKATLAAAGRRRPELPQGREHSELRSWALSSVRTGPRMSFSPPDPCGAGLLWRTVSWFRQRATATHSNRSRAALSGPGGAADVSPLVRVT